MRTHIPLSEVLHVRLFEIVVSSFEVVECEPSVPQLNSPDHVVL